MRTRTIWAAALLLMMAQETFGQPAPRRRLPQTAEEIDTAIRRIETRLDDVRSKAARSGVPDAAFASTRDEVVESDQ